MECATCASIYPMDWAPEGKSPKDFMRAVNASTDAQNKHLQRVAAYEAEDPVESSRATVRRLRTLPWCGNHGLEEPLGGEPAARGNPTAGRGVQMAKRLPGREGLCAAPAHRCLCAV